LEHSVELGRDAFDGGRRRGRQRIGSRNERPPKLAFGPRGVLVLPTMHLVRCLFPGGQCFSEMILTARKITRQRVGVRMQGDSDFEEFLVLINDEEQYSLWPARLAIPAGWRETGSRGAEEECAAYVDAVWTDMRPKSLRKFLQQE
jgi:MbtH protein